MSLDVLAHNPPLNRGSALSTAVWVRHGELVVVALADAAGDWGLGGEACPVAAERMLARLNAASTDPETALRDSFEATTRELGPRFTDDLGIHAAWSAAAAVVSQGEARVAWAGSCGVALLREGAVLWRSTPHLLLPDAPDGHPLKTVVGRLQGDPGAWAPPQQRRLELASGDQLLLYSRAVEKLFVELEGDGVLVEASPVPLVDRLVAFAMWEPSVVLVRVG